MQRSATRAAGRNVLLSVALVACGGREGGPPPRAESPRVLLTLPDGKKVGLLSEVLPGRDSKATYAVTYLSSVQDGDCAVVAELEGVWSVVRGTAERTKAFAVILEARHAGGPSSIVVLSHMPSGWKETQGVPGCDDVLR